MFQIFVLFLAVCAAAMAFYLHYRLNRMRDELMDIVANLALEVSKLDKEEEEPQRPDQDAGRAWEEAINNLMAYELKDYGLNVGFLHREDE